jgi:glycerol-3-phosphate dehydrogenase
MKRAEQLKKLNGIPAWDMVIIGGGATGLGAALDAASRGYTTLLLEKADFGKGTSSRSTKLVHGGVRYLQQGNIKLVREALRERGYLLKNAPHLTQTQSFIVPVFSWWEKIFYATGLSIYDLLSGKLSLGKTKILSRKTVLQHLPGIHPEKVKGGVRYYDGQFDDSRLCVDLAATAVTRGAVLLNYASVTSLVKENKKLTGLVFEDLLSGLSHTISAKAVINATGVFTDAILQMDDSTATEMVSPSQGIHLVVNRSFFPGDDAMMIPKTDDGRVLFAVPWHGETVIGTTDTPVDHADAEPRPLEEEISFLIRHFNRYAAKPIERTDVKSVFAGLRPLVKNKGTRTTSLLSRDHTLVISNSGLVTITGGKWTTYRKMAEDAVDNALFVSKQEKKFCITTTLAIGNIEERQQQLALFMQQDPSLDEKLLEAHPYTWADLYYAVQHEMAMTVEDLLARRTRILFLDAEAAIRLAEPVAARMAVWMQKDKAWEENQTAAFRKLAQQYLLS